jgi:hypothetical protein
MDKSFIALCLILLLVSSLLFVNYKRITSSGFECLQNPLSYGAKVWGEENNKNMTCLCRFDVTTSPNIFVNKFNVTITGQ